MADIITKTPTGCLTSSFGNDSKFEVRPESGGSILQLKSQASMEDLFDTDPLGSRLTVGDGTWVYDSTRKRVKTNGNEFHHVWFTNVDVIADVEVSCIVRLGAYAGIVNRGGCTIRLNSSTGACYALEAIGESPLQLYLREFSNWTTRASLDVSTERFAAGALVRLKLKAVGTTIKGKMWLVDEAEPMTGGPDGDGYQVKAVDGTLASGRVGMWADTNGVLDCQFDEYRVDHSYPNTSPVRYCVWDSGRDDTEWASGTAKVVTNKDPRYMPLDDGTVKVKEAYSNTLYGSGDEAAVDAIASDTWLTPDGNDEVTLAGGEGRYRYLLYQFVSDGTQQASLSTYDEGQTATISIDATAPGDPSITILTPGDGEVVASIIADDPADDIELRYRTAGADASWSAESGSLSRTGSGDITVSGLTNGVTYQFGIYATLGAGVNVLRSEWDFGIASPYDAAIIPTELDEDMVPETLAIIEEFGFSAVFTSYLSETHNPATGVVTKSGGVETQRKISPPKGINPRLIDGDNIREGDQICLAAASGLTFDITAGMKIAIGSQQWRLISVAPIRSGEQIAAYKMQIRRSGS